MSVTVITDLEAAVRGAPTVTIDQLANGKGFVYRHPDSAQISYPKAVTTAIGSLPAGGGTYHIAIVGGGAAGIAALYELRKLADANPTWRLVVYVLEADPY